MGKSSLFRSKDGADDNWKRIPFDEIEKRKITGDVFAADEDKLAPLLSKAAGANDVPTILGASARPSLVDRNLTFEGAALWLLDQMTLSPDVHHRLALLLKFALRERFTNNDAHAMRYLMHAHAEYRNQVFYLTAGGNNDLWKAVFQCVLDAVGEAWRIVGNAFSPPLSESLRKRLEVDACSREAWPALLRKLDQLACEIDFSGLDAASLEWILQETSEDDLQLIKPLKIHRLSSGEMVAATNCTVWLAGELDVPEQLLPRWEALRRKARVLSRSPKPAVSERQKQLFAGRILDASGALKLAAASQTPGDYWELILHLLCEGAASIDACEAIAKARWLPLNDGGFIEPSNINASRQTGTSSHGCGGASRTLINSTLLDNYHAGP